MVEPTIFAQAKPRQNGSNLDLLELSRKLKSVTARDDFKMLENIRDGNLVGDLTGDISWKGIVILYFLFFAFIKCQASLNLDS